MQAIPVWKKVLEDKSGMIMPLNVAKDVDLQVKKPKIKKVDLVRFKRKQSKIHNKH